MFGDGHGQSSKVDTRAKITNILIGDILCWVIYVIYVMSFDL